MGQPPAIPSTIQEIIDQHAVIAALTAYLACIDEHRFDDVPDCFVEGGGLVFDSRSIRGAENLRGKVGAELSRYVLTQHLVTNHVVSLDGDRATLTASAIGTHVIEAGTPSKVSMVGGRYTCKLLRTPDGWRFDTIEPGYLWISGEPMLH